MESAIENQNEGQKNGGARMSTLIKNLVLYQKIKWLEGCKLKNKKIETKIQNCIFIRLNFLKKMQIFKLAD